jgi:hypothetical protein
MSKVVHRMGRSLVTRAFERWAKCARDQRKSALVQERIIGRIRLLLASTSMETLA